MIWSRSLRICRRILLGPVSPLRCFAAPWVVVGLFCGCATQGALRVSDSRDLEAGAERLLTLELAAGRFSQVTIVPATADIEVEVEVEGSTLSVWRDGRWSETGIRCPAGHESTLRWVASVDQEAVLSLRSNVTTTVDIHVTSRPASVAESRAWEKTSRLIAALEAGDQNVPSAQIAEAIAAVDAVMGEGSETALAHIEGLAHRSVDAGQLDQAVELFMRALARRPQVDGDAVADLLSGLATATFYQGKWSEAFDFETQALEIRRRVLAPDHPAVAKSLVQMAVVQWQQARFRDAAVLLDEALLVLDRGVGDPLELAEALHIQGEILRELGRFDDSEIALRRSVTLWQSSELSDYLHAATRNSLGKLLRDRGQYVEADRHLTRALELSADDPTVSPADRVTWQLNRAELLRLSGQLDAAGPLYRSQLEAARELYGNDHPGLLLHLNQTAVYLTEAGLLGAAAELFVEVTSLARSALDANHPFRAQALDDLATLERLRGRPEQAIAAYREALDIRQVAFGSEHPEVAVTLTGLAEALADTGADDDALRELEQALHSLRGSTLFPDARARALYLRARLADRGGDRSGAVAVLSEALTLVESLRSAAAASDRSLAGFFARYRDLYHLMVEWRIAQQRPDLAFATSERARGRAFLDQLAVNGVDLLEGVPADLRQRLDDERREMRERLAETQSRLALARQEPASAKAQLASWEHQTTELAGRLQAVEARIRGVSPAWQQLVTRRGQPATAADVQGGLLEDDRMLVEYQIGPESSYVFVVPPHGPMLAERLVLDEVSAEHLSTTPGPLTTAVLADAVSRALPWRLSATRGLDELVGGGSEAARHALWRVLVGGPLARYLEGTAGHVAEIAEILVIPDGALHQLPFELLVPELVSDGTARRYWLDEGPVLRYGLSATVLLNLEDRRRSDEASRRVIIVANPAPSTDRGWIAGALRTLPGTAREASSIAAWLSAAGDRELVTLLGADARESSVRRALREPAAILHVATHGIVEAGRHESLAALALTPPPTVTSAMDDGLLQLHEIYQLDLAVDLAVLSACDTSRGRNFDGEGAYALSRGFLAAGANRVVASLWPVDDSSTADLMSAFYRHLVALGPGADVVRALGAAKHEMRGHDETADPFFWAGFVLIGLS